MKTEKTKSLRGSVLFTVVAVMALLIIFLTGTLALASATSNRAHKSYASSQASYTARAAINGFTEAMKRNDGLVATIQAMGNNPIYPNLMITEDGTNPDESIGLIGCYDADTGAWKPNCIKIEPVTGSKEYAYVLKDATNQTYAWEEVQAVKLSVSCRVGREEESVSAYIKKKGSSAPQSVPGGSSKIKGLNTAGTANFPNGGAFTGGLGIGIQENIPGKFVQTNATTIDTSLTFINGSYESKTSTFQIYVRDPADKDPTKNPRPYSETVVNGNLQIANNEFITIDYVMDRDFTQKDIPYLYVDKAFLVDSGGQLVKSNGQPYNMFIGTMKTTKNSVDLGNVDLYLMDKPDGSTYTVGGIGVTKGQNFIGKTTGSKLYEWTYSAVHKTDTQHSSVGGNIYCNGDLTLRGMDVAGDVRVDGDLIFAQDGQDNNCKVGGDIVCKGNLVIADASKLTVGGAIYCDHVNGAKSAGVKVYAVDSKEHQEAVSETPDYVKVDCDLREYFAWNTGDHPSGTSPDDFYELNGGETHNNETLYYRYYSEYAPGMKIFSKDNEGSKEYMFLYADEDDSVAGEGFVKENDSVDDVLTKIKTSYKPGNDALADAVVDRFIDTSICSSSVEQIDGKNAYRVVPQVLGKNGDTPILRHTSVISPDQSWAAAYYNFNTGEYTDPYNAPAGKTTQELYYTKQKYDWAHLDPWYNAPIDTGERTLDLITYYNESGTEISRADYMAMTIDSSATITGFTIKPYADFGESAYPASMTREAIWMKQDGAGGKTAADPTTKIVKTLAEARADMGFDQATGAIDSTKYYKDVPQDAKFNTVKQKAYTTFNNATNTKNKNVWGVWDGATPADNFINKSCTISGTLQEDVYIKATSEMWVILENVKLSGKKIVVDDSSTGKVNFLIKGTLSIDTVSTSNNAGILRSNLLGNNAHITADDDWGMDFYGAENSAIRCSNYATLCGSFKCPYTTYKAADGGSVIIKSYKDENGYYWVQSNGDLPSGATKVYPGNDDCDNKPSLIGNALFKEVFELKNKFGMYYTASGTGTSNPGGNPGNGGVIPTGLGYFEIQYFNG